MNEIRQSATNANGGSLIFFNGGVQTVPDLQASPRQIIYLDFDGELTKYRNADLDMVIDEVQVEDSMLTPDRIDGIVASLNTKFSANNVLFTSERPKDTAYSTIFVGKTSAFDQYGSFAGLAETVDLGNRIKNDNAFVLLDASNSDSDIVSTIAHEAGHIIGTIDHGGDALYRYAATTYYYIQNNCTVTGDLVFSTNHYAPDDHSESHYYLVHYASDREYVSSSWNYDNTNSYECVSSRYDKAASLPVDPTEVLHVSSNCLASNIQINGYSSWRGALLISRGGSSVDVRTFSSSYIEVRGVAINTTLNSEGLLLILSGGTAKTTTVNKGANLNISSGGSATAIRENGGYVHVSSGAYAAFVANTFSGMYFSNGQSASLHSATTAIKPYVSSNARIDVLGGTAISASVTAGGFIYVYNGGVASSTQIYNSGVMCVSSGGKADNTAVNYAGSMCLYNGGKANVTVISGGSLYVSSGGTANDTTLSGQMGIMHVYGGGTANVTVISGGSLYVSSGGIANDTVISGGSLLVCDGGKASVTTVNSSGSFYIYSGGTATGQMKFYKGAVVSAASGAIIDFNISEIATDFTARVNDLSVVSGRDKADYTITVSDKQANGIYVLAKGASDFNKTISVVGTSGETLGTLAIGNAVKINGTDYVLNLKNDVLSVRIGDWEPARINYAFTDIGQTVYYDGEKPNDCELEGTLMAIPYTADITITFDKTLGFGEYEFTTSVAEVPGSVNNCKIQIADAEGVPDLNGDYNKWSVAYISHDACCYGTKIGETDTTVTYKFTNVSDYLLIDSIPNNTLEIGVATGASYDWGPILSSSPQKLTYYSGNRSDVNKQVRVFEIKGSGSLRSGEQYDFTIKISGIDHRNNKYNYAVDYKIGNNTYNTISVTENGDLISFSITANPELNADISITVDQKQMQLRQDLFTFGNNIANYHLYGDKLQDWAPWDKNHCWIAVAANMLDAAGYLSVSAQRCYEILNERYYTFDQMTSKMSIVQRVFKDLTSRGFNLLEQSCGRNGNSTERLESVLSDIGSDKGVVGAISFGKHVITCYSISFDQQKTRGTITYANDADVNDNLNNPQPNNTTTIIKKASGKWFISYGEADQEITGVYSLIFNNNPSERLTETKLQNIALKRINDSLTLYCTGYSDVSISEDGSATVSGSFYDSVILDEGNLTIASGAEAEEMVVHTGGTVQFNSGSIAKGKIRTAGGVLTVESGVNVSEAEFDFALSYMESGNNTRLLNDLHNVSGAKLSITIVNGQADGKYVLAGGAADFNGTLSVVGEYNCLQKIGEGFEDGFIGELGLDNALYIEGKNYFLKLEEDELALMISSEGVSDIVVPSGGARVVSSGQVYIDTIVNSDGSMVVSSGGMVNDITLNPGGGLYVSSGGKMTGRMVFSSGAIVSAYDGAIVDFDLTQTSAGAASAIINDLSVVKGRPVFTLTVDGTQANGAYKLAEGVSGFGRTITIKNASGDLLGTISVGETTRIADSDFTLVLSGSTHTLSLGINVDIIPPTVTNVTANTSELTSRSVTVTAEFADNVAIASAFYRIGETGPWTAYENGVTVSQNATIYFKAVDTSGNESEIVSYPVTNIINHTVVSGGVTQNNIHVSSGQMYYNTVLNGGFMYVSSGGIANSTTLNSNGRIYLYGGGAIYNTTAGSGCWINVSSGGVMNKTMLSGGGLIYLSGGRANNTTIYSGGIFSVFSGGVANTADIYSSGRLAVSSGGVASSVTVYKSGQLYVQSDSIANDTVLQGGVLFVASDGTVNSTTVNSGGWLILYDGGMVNNTILNSGGSLLVSSGGTANNTTIYSGGFMYYSSCGMAYNTTIYSGGTLYVSSDCTANSTTVKAGGILKVSSGGTATIAFSPWRGSIVSASGAQITYLDRDANIYYEDANSLLKKCSILNFMVFNSGYRAVVYSGGTANNTTITSGGSLIVSGGGTANGLVISSGGSLIVSSGGSAYGVKENGGYVNIADGANVTFAANSFSGLALRNNATIHSGTTAYNTTVSSGGTLYVYGGKASDTINFGGCTYISSGGTANNTTVNAGRLDVYGGVANDTMLYGGSMYTNFGGVDNNTTIYSGGSLYVLSGGTANNTTVSSGGSLIVSNGGKAYGVKENGGYVIIADGANVTFAANSFSGLVLSNNATIHSGTTANSTTVNSGGRMEVFSGGIANNTIHNGGITYIRDGGTANNTTIEKGGFNVYGGMANGTTVNKGGGMFVYGGMANDTTINAGGSLHLSGGTANNTTITSGGSLIVSSGGTANGLIISSGGSLKVSSGGTAYNISTFSGCTYSILNGGTAYGFNINSGVNFNIRMAIKDTMINFGGRTYVSSGGKTDNTVVNSGGSLYLSSGGKLTGQTTIENGAIVSAYEGAIVDFDISTITSDATARINDLSLISDWTNASFTLTVSDLQANGVYRLADGAAGFNQTISVFNASGAQPLNVLKVGETVKVGETDYTLNLDESSLLSVTVGTIVVPEPDPVSEGRFFPGCYAGGKQAMLAKQTDDMVTVYCEQDTWGYGLALDPGWEIAGVGDFDGDGRDDFLRVNGEGYVVGEMTKFNGKFTTQVLNFLNEGWSILGVGDFNGNGADDVLIANPTAASETVGLLGYWESGVTWTLINGYSAEWECIATGDFNADGKCDMLWRNSFEGDGGLTYNAYCTWIVDDPVDWRMVSVANPAEWNFLCSGDFNGDKMNDIAMINDVGVVGIWGVNDGYLSSWSILSAVTSEWQLAGVADFNGDGTDDIAWSNTETGLVGCWQIENKELASWQTIASLA